MAGPASDYDRLLKKRKRQMSRILETEVEPASCAMSENDRAFLLNIIERFCDVDPDAEDLGPTAKTAYAALHAEVARIRKSYQ
jgi:hypothetical protein